MLTSCHIPLWVSRDAGLVYNVLVQVWLTEQVTWPCRSNPKSASWPWDLTPLLKVAHMHLRGIDQKANSWLLLRERGPLSALGILFFIDYVTHWPHPGEDQQGIRASFERKTNWAPAMHCNGSLGKLWLTGDTQIKLLTMPTMTKSWHRP